MHTEHLHKHCAQVTQYYHLLQILNHLLELMEHEDLAGAECDYILNGQRVLLNSVDLKTRNPGELSVSSYYKEEGCITDGERQDESPVRYTNATYFLYVEPDARTRSGKRIAQIALWDGVETVLVRNAITNITHPRAEHAHA